MCLWVPMYPSVGLLIVVRFLRGALECRYARLWFMAVSTGTVCPVANGFGQPQEGILMLIFWN